MDSVWLVLKKRPVSFLQEYHHLTVMLYCWHVSYGRNYGAAPDFEGGEGSYFGLMNGCVHFVMYGYYAITSCTSKNSIFRSKLVAISITRLQVCGLQSFNSFLHQGNSWKPCCANGRTNQSKRLNDLAVQLYSRFCKWSLVFLSKPSRHSAVTTGMSAMPAREDMVASAVCGLGSLLRLCTWERFAATVQTTMPAQLCTRRTWSCLLSTMWIDTSEVSEERKLERAARRSRALTKERWTLHSPNMDGEASHFGERLQMMVMSQFHYVKAFGSIKTMEVVPPGKAIGGFLYRDVLTFVLTRLRRTGEKHVQSFALVY